MRERLKKYLTPFYAFALYKVLTGVLELAGGILVMFFSATIFNDIIVALTSRELIEDPGDIFVAVILHYIAYLPKIKFVGILIFINGIYDSVTGVGLFFRKKWAYHVILFILIASIPFELYELIATPQIYKFISLFLTSVFLLILIRLRPRQLI